MFEQLMPGPGEDVECYAAQLEHLGFAELTTYLDREDESIESELPQPARLDQVDVTTERAA